MTRIVHPICHVDRQPCLHGLAEFGPKPTAPPSPLRKRQIRRRTRAMVRAIRRAPMPVVERATPAPYDPAVFHLEPAAAPEPFPEPIATSRDGHMPPTMPAPVKALQAAVERAGWATLVQHSEGHVPHATHGRPGAAVKPVWALRMRKGARSAVAVRTGAAWEFFYVWSPAGFQRFKALGLFQEALG